MGIERADWELKDNEEKIEILADAIDQLRKDVSALSAKMEMCLSQIRVLKAERTG